ncbi:hypothetical protein LbFV_ORF36 [Leptopilina boulardi filamentous virus]|uniref:Uncharacterized protein n=1 Tax=Leptopilina boulardi filamentous virus TaxID=552509 RepID=A0A1S5YD77_9VIRU|nr:hypothetical protein LbFV_ORF36 [Leptopilina boulardi filamentous virus]AQQ79956.1 hypothetical protein LbFV_ORF36 [Leptopilina boulardi filamentous virus]
MGNSSTKNNDKNDDEKVIHNSNLKSDLTLINADSLKGHYIIVYEELNINSLQKIISSLHLFLPLKNSFHITFCCLFNNNLKKISLEEKRDFSKQCLDRNYEFSIWEGIGCWLSSGNKLEIINNEIFLKRSFLKIHDTEKNLKILITKKKTELCDYFFNDDNKILTLNEITADFEKENKNLSLYENLTEKNHYVKFSFQKTKSALNPPANITQNTGMINFIFVKNMRELILIINSFSLLTAPDKQILILIGKKDIFQNKFKYINKYLNSAIKYYQESKYFLKNKEHIFISNFQGSISKDNIYSFISSNIKISLLYNKNLSNKINFSINLNDNSIFINDPRYYVENLSFFTNGTGQQKTFIYKNLNSSTLSNLYKKFDLTLLMYKNCSLYNLVNLIFSIDQFSNKRNIFFLQNDAFRDISESTIRQFFPKITCFLKKYNENIFIIHNLSNINKDYEIIINDIIYKNNKTTNILLKVKPIITKSTNIKMDEMLFTFNENFSETYNMTNTLVFNPEYNTLDSNIKRIQFLSDKLQTFVSGSNLSSVQNVNLFFYSQNKVIQNIQKALFIDDLFQSSYGNNFIVFIRDLKEEDVFDLYEFLTFSKKIIVCGTITNFDTIKKNVIDKIVQKKFSTFSFTYLTKEMPQKIIKSNVNNGGENNESHNNEEDHLEKKIEKEDLFVISLRNDLSIDNQNINIPDFGILRVDNENNTSGPSINILNNTINLIKNEKIVIPRFKISATNQVLNKIKDFTSTSLYHLNDEILGIPKKELKFIHPLSNTNIKLCGGKQNILIFNYDFKIPEITLNESAISSITNDKKITYLSFQEILSQSTILSILTTFTTALQKLQNCTYILVFKLNFTYEEEFINNLLKEMNSKYSFMKYICQAVKSMNERFIIVHPESKKQNFTITSSSIVYNAKSSIRELNNDKIKFEIRFFQENLLNEGVLIFVDDLEKKMIPFSYNYHPSKSIFLLDKHQMKSISYFYSEEKMEKIEWNLNSRIEHDDKNFINIMIYNCDENIKFLYQFVYGLRELNTDTVAIINVDIKNAVITSLIENIKKHLVQNKSSSNKLWNVLLSNGYLWLTNCAQVLNDKCILPSPLEFLSVLIKNNQDDEIKIFNRKLRIKNKQNSSKLTVDINYSNLFLHDYYSTDIYPFFNNNNISIDYIALYKIDNTAAKINNHFDMSINKTTYDDDTQYKVQIIVLPELLFREFVHLLHYFLTITNFKRNIYIVSMHRNALDNVKNVLSYYNHNTLEIKLFTIASTDVVFFMAIYNKNEFNIPNVIRTSDKDVNLDIEYLTNLKIQNNAQIFTMKLTTTPKSENTSSAFFGYNPRKIVNLMLMDKKNYTITSALSTFSGSTTRSYSFLDTTPNIKYWCYNKEVLFNFINSLDTRKMALKNYCDVFTFYLQHTTKITDYINRATYPSKTTHITYLFYDMLNLPKTEAYAYPSIIQYIYTIFQKHQTTHKNISCSIIFLLSKEAEIIQRKKDVIYSKNWSFIKDINVTSKELLNTWKKNLHLLNINSDFSNFQKFTLIEENKDYFLLENNTLQISLSKELTTSIKYNDKKKYIHLLYNDLHKKFSIDNTTSDYSILSPQVDNMITNILENDNSLTLQVIVN